MKLWLRNAIRKRGFLHVEDHARIVTESARLKYRVYRLEKTLRAISFAEEPFAATLAREVLEEKL